MTWVLSSGTAGLRIHTRPASMRGVDSEQRVAALPSSQPCLIRDQGGLPELMELLVNIRAVEEPDQIDQLRKLARTLGVPVTELLE